MKPRRPTVARVTTPSGGSPSGRGKVSLLEKPDGALPVGKVLDFPAPRRSHRLRNVILAVTAAALVLGGVVAYVVFSPALALRTVVVEGNTLVSTEEIHAALAPLSGTSLTQISPDRVRGMLEDKAPIEDVRIAAEPPSTLVVTVQERIPVAVLQNGADVVLIDAEGRQLARVADRAQVKLPLIDGGTNAVNSEVFSSITAVLAELPVSVLSRLNSASAASVDSIRLSLTGDQRIFWGSSERSAEKAEVLEAMLAMPASDPPVKEFDVSTPDRPVTR
ncbi:MULTISPECIES: cell division protein FtsQ/DivIB [unclassified Arthrobacter]|uniref:cell division protein FtsQ/DivIB n=1 Tax=Arthrobacter sp. Leaf234 TaxID=1736303 RepID=UPI0009EC8908|nr:FtsQ-type POTRA domain-containing protein [Arthrobacter sp. Leaf234]